MPEAKILQELRSFKNKYAWDKSLNPVDSAPLSTEPPIIQTESFDPIRAFVEAKRN